MDVEIIPNDSTRNEKKKSQKKKRKVEDGISKSNNSEMDNTLALMEITKTTTQSDSAPTSDEGSRIKTSIFDYCVENHFKAMDLIDKLCSENGYDFLDDTEIQRLAPSITFLSEWRYFMYKSRLIRFAFEMGHPNETQAPNEITLPQFSAALVPNCDMEAENPGSVLAMNSRKDFLLYVGGLVWSLDWCPKTDQVTKADTRCEFIAVAAHPPDSTHHKIGAPVSGRGMIQIWCILSNTFKQNNPTPIGIARPRGRPMKKVDDKPVRPRGRPRKNPIMEISTPNPEGQTTLSLGQIPETTAEVPPTDESTHINKVGSEEGNSKQEKTGRKVRKDGKSQISGDKNVVNDPVSKEPQQRKSKSTSKKKVTTDDTDGVPNYKGKSFEVVGIDFPDPIKDTEKSQGRKRVVSTDMEVTLAGFRKKCKKKSKSCNNLDNDKISLGTPILEGVTSIASVKENQKKDNLVLEGYVGSTHSNPDFGDDRVVKDEILPRVVMCIGHDGKIAWDVKWRPVSSGDSFNKHRLGYLAVILGNGSIEVWEIPSPQVVNCVYKSRRGKDIDPRFVKLKPVFRSSMLKYGDRQSMPLTLEWSASPPHDLILAGCHDGVVALWKFSTDVSSGDAKPLLCFSAEIGPIRSLSWAPYEGDPESSNIIVTAGHGGLKFWDLRDPFRPLWDAIPSQRFIYSLDWVPDPRCLLVTYDDGTMRMLSLTRAAYDVPVTGQSFSGTHQQGLHSFHCSSFAIWSIHISRLTGMVAYCCADGTVLYFQLTHKAVDKDPLRNRAPHFLCGSLVSEEPVITVNAQLSSSPHRMKKSATEWANTPRSARTVASGLNQSKKTKKTVKTLQLDDEVLASSDGDEDENNGDINEARTNAKGGKTKANNFKKANGEKTNEIVQISEEGNDRVEVPPSKIISMYRVRWNMNKGSERWLCYGGAAGIVRCQEIVAPVFDKKLLKF